MEYFGCMGKVARHSSSLPLRSKNKLVETWLRDDDSPWLWMVDADMIFDDGHAMKLWECASENNAKIVSGLAFIFHGMSQPTPSYFLWGDDPRVLAAGQTDYNPQDLVNPNNWIPDEPIEVAATGLASVLIHRDVFETMQPDFHEAYRWFHTFKLNYAGEPFGEDMQFFVRCQELGFKHMLEPRARTHHVKEISVDYDAWTRAWKKSGEDSTH